jgi:hypothetical protein
LDQLFTIDLRSSAPGTPMPVSAPQPLRVNGVEDKTTRAETMLEAHEACVEANPENAAKFKDVLDYLKQDLHLAH